MCAPTPARFTTFPGSPEVKYIEKGPEPWWVNEVAKREFLHGQTVFCFPSVPVRTDMSCFPAMKVEPAFPGFSRSSR